MNFDEETVPLGYRSETKYFQGHECPTFVSPAVALAEADFPVQIGKTKMVVPNMPSGDAQRV